MAQEGIIYMTADTPYVELLDRELVERMTNKFGQPVLGWKPIPGVEGIYNPRGFASMMVLHHTPDGQPLYEQPMFGENPGAFVVIVDKVNRRVALIEQYRMIADRILVGQPGNYVEEVTQEGRWDEVVEGLGRKSLEPPQGLIQDTTEQSLIKTVLKAAGQEALEEAGITIRDAKILGEINWNPTFAMHNQWAVMAEIESVGTTQPEELEHIGKMTMVPFEEIPQLIKAGKIFNACSIAVMAMAGIPVAVN